MHRIRKTSLGFEVFNDINQRLAILDTKKEAIYYSWGHKEINKFIVPLANKWQVIDKRGKDKPSQYKFISEHKTEKEALKALEEYIVKREAKTKKNGKGK